MQSNSIIFAIDFDGTCVTHEFPEIGKDIGAEDVLRELVTNGHRLILYTMRSNSQEHEGFSDDVPVNHKGKHLDEAVAWFKRKGIPLYGIQKNPTQHNWTESPKCYAHIYIDDAALGCPLIQADDERPYVDWKSVRLLLSMKGIL